MADNLTNFDPQICPVGISNEKDIEHLGDRLDMAIERLTEKVSEMKEDITSLHKGMDEKFESVDKKFDAVDKRFDSMEDNFNKKLDELKESVPNTIDDQLDRKKGSTAYAAIRWIFCGLLSGVLITVLGAWAKAKLGL